MLGKVTLHIKTNLPAVHDLPNILGEESPVLVVPYNRWKKAVSSELSGVNRRCRIHTAKDLGCKGNVREPPRGVAVTMFGTPQPDENEHYHAI
ncbi:hypothetical protein TNCV_3417821 [Trichonephila clavipes]|nr:hypothetical protein TNCV_3417821 [Trichonephila clavipes]